MFGKKFLSKNPNRAYIPCTKSLAWCFYCRLGVVVIFYLRGENLTFFWDPTNQKTVQKGCKRVLKNILKKTWVLCPFLFFFLDLFTFYQRRTIFQSVWQNNEQSLKNPNSLSVFFPHGMNKSQYFIKKRRNHLFKRKKIFFTKK